MKKTNRNISRILFNICQNCWHHILHSALVENASNEQVGDYIYEQILHLQRKQISKSSFSVNSTQSNPFIQHGLLSNWIVGNIMMFNTFICFAFVCLLIYCVFELGFFCIFTFNICSIPIGSSKWWCWTCSILNGKG